MRCRLTQLGRSISVMLLTAWLGWACVDAESPAEPTDDTLPTAANHAGGRFDGPPSRLGTPLQRTVLAGNVVHYTWEVRVGRGPLDVVRLHRVVKEPRHPSRRPVPKMEGVMLLPGAPQLFERIFLPPASPSVPTEEGSVALFLASNGVDVWGMDYGWTAVPYESPDVPYLGGWGIAKDAEHVEIALSLARWQRARSGQGSGPIHVLGFSYGGFLAYAVAGEDTQRRGNLKNVKGMIPVDGTAFKVPPGSSQQTNACDALPAIQDGLNAGTYVTDNSIFFKLGEAALTAPDDPSAFVPGFTNYQAPLFLLVSGGYLGGSYTTSPPSVTLLYTYGPRAVGLLEDNPPYVPYQWEYDFRASRCGSAAYPVTFDDHLADVTVPILYLQRGDVALYTTTLTASGDVTSMLFNPTFDPSLYGHADFFLADDAADVVWRPILEWIRAHAEGHHQHAGHAGHPR